MSKKRRGKFNLSEALDFLNETTVSRGYPDDGTGVATDDDRPTGNIVYGEKYKRTPYFNKLTDYQDSWEVDLGDWTWDEFENSDGMDDKRNYSNTIMGLKDLLPSWKNVWRRMKYITPEDAEEDFEEGMQGWREAGEDQIGGEKFPYMKVNPKTRNSKLIGKIDTLTK